MKYYTKEVNQFQYATLYHMPLEKDPDSENRSEELFRELFQKEFHENPENSSHWESYQKELRVIEDHIPSSVLAHVADKRVLALRHVSPKLYRKIKKILNRTGKKYLRLEKQYQRIFKKQVKALPAYFSFLYMHDAKIVHVRQQGNDLILQVYGCNIFMPHKDKGFFILKNAKILEQECPLESMTVLDDEIYVTESGYEWHFLVHFWQEEYFYVTFAFDDIWAEPFLPGIEYPDMKDYGRESVYPDITLRE